MWLPETQQRWEWGPMGFGTALVNIAFPVQISSHQGETKENQRKGLFMFPLVSSDHRFKWVLSEDLKNSITFILTTRCYCHILVSYQMLPNYFWQLPRDISHVVISKSSWFPHGDCHFALFLLQCNFGNVSFLRCPRLSEQAFLLYPADKTEATLYHTQKPMWVMPLF